MPIPVINEKSIRRYFKPRKKTSHKTDNGVALVIGGSENYTGAPALGAMAALSTLRSGIDLCIVAAPEKTGWVISKYSPDLIVKKLKGKTFSKKHLKVLFEEEKRADAVLIGPGMGREKQTLALAREFVKKSKKKIVIDADALHACSEMKFKNPTIITPHTKEFQVFTGKNIAAKTLNEKIRIVQENARKYNCTILLKGQTDIISNGKKTALNKTGNAAMTVGGTGDVLAGLCTGFIALGATPLHAASAAAFVNGKIGEKLYKKMGYSLIASDFIAQIPYWIKRILK